MVTFFGLGQPRPTTITQLTPSAADTRLAPAKKGHVDALFVVLSRFFQELEAGRADKLMPSFGYVWRFYKPPMTVERMRSGLARIDEYVAEQMGYVNGQLLGNHLYTAPPSMSRLPDLAVVALFQEVDALLASQGYKPKPAEEVKGC